MSSTVGIHSPLFARLKSSTEKQHRELETLVNPFQTFCSLESYKTYLSKALTFYQLLEGDLQSFDWTSIGIDFPSRQKTHLLEQDLRALGIPFPPVKHPSRLTQVPDQAFGLGCLYVLEGASLGGQIISRHLEKLGIGPENGGLFFQGYGAATGQMWKSFQSAATCFCVTEAQISAAVVGARWTFDMFRQALTPLEDHP